MNFDSAAIRTNSSDYKNIVHLFSIYMVKGVSFNYNFKFKYNFNYNLKFVHFYAIEIEI